MESLNVCLKYLHGFEVELVVEEGVEDWVGIVESVGVRVEMPLQQQE